MRIFNKFTHKLSALPSLLIFAALSSIIVFSSFRGLDITDDSFYIMNIWYPLRNYGAVSEFGKYLSIFSFFVGRDVVSIRIIFFCALVLLGLFASLRMAKIFGSLGYSNGGSELVTVTCALCVSALAYYKYWLLTPSYNLFALFGPMIVGTALAGALEELRRDWDWRTAVRIGFWIGLGGAITAIGRPTGAVVAGVIAGFWLITFLRFKNALVVGLVSIATIAIILSIHVWYFDREWPIFIQRIVFARDLAASLGAGQSLASSLARMTQTLAAIPARLLIGPYMIGLVAAVLCYGIQLLVLPRYFSAPSRRIAFAAAAGSICLLAKSLLSVQSDFYLGRLGLELALLQTTLLLFGAWLAPKKSSSGDTVEAAGLRGHYLVASLHSAPFVLLALTSSFGSTNDLIAASGQNFILYAAAIVIAWSGLIPPELRFIKMGMHTLLCIGVACGLLHAAQNPYRLADSLSRQTQPILLMDSKTLLRVDQATANWADSLKQAAVADGWTVGTPLIDMTGGTPGAALLLGAYAPTTPWLVGGYSGSEDYVTMALKATDKQLLDRAWILTAPDGIRHIETSVLRSIGLAFPDNYSLVGQFRTGHRNEVQFLWKPEESTP